MAFSLNSIKRSGSPKPPRVVIYGTEGIGKSTFGADAPAPIFIPTENGLDAITVDAFPLCKSFADVMECVRVLAEDEHEFQTVVLDSADWTEQLIQLQVAADVGITTYNIQHKDLAYGRGAKAVADYWRNLLDAFDYLRDEKNMQVIIIAHNQVKRFDDPTTDAYDRYQLDLGKESASLVREWCDVLGFASRAVSVKEEKVGINGKKSRGVGSDERFLHTQEKPAFQAKSRWAIPDKMPFGYDTFAAALAAAMAPAHEETEAKPAKSGKSKGA